MTRAFQKRWTSEIVEAAYALRYGEHARIINHLDLSEADGAMLCLSVGRYATGTFSAGATVSVRPTFGTNAHLLGGDVVAFTTSTTYNIQRINNAAGYEAGAAYIAFDGQTGTAFSAQSDLCFWGLTTMPTESGPLSNDNVEFVKVSKGTSTPLVPDALTKFAHADNEFITAADRFSPIWLPGGSAYEILFDAGAETTTSAVFLLSAAINVLNYTFKTSVRR